jgi:hypothetical protein
MIIKKPGKYRLLKDFIDRGPRRVGTIPAGTIIKITSVNYDNHEVIGPSLFDWNHWDMPVEEVKEVSR